jgi:uncharacterized damage-inducible protein DinB
MSEELKYPIGKFAYNGSLTVEQIREHISTIENFPSKLSKEVIHLTDEQLNTPYRDGGWTLAQVVNHVSDSHANSLTRFKLALTEDRPIIKPYHQDLWAELADGKMPVAPALKLIEGLHQRWVVLLKSITPEQWERTFFHPEKGKEMSLEETLALYAWHCSHHLAHITELKKRKGWI